MSPMPQIVRRAQVRRAAPASKLTVPDRAEVITTAILQTMAQHLAADGALRDALTSLLREELADVTRQVLSEIRIEG